MKYAIRLCLARKVEWLRLLDGVLLQCDGNLRGEWELEEANALAAQWREQTTMMCGDPDGFGLRLRAVSTGPSCEVVEAKPIIGDYQLMMLARARRPKGKSRPKTGGKE